MRIVGLKMINNKRLTTTEKYPLRAGSILAEARGFLAAAGLDGREAETLLADLLDTDRTGLLRDDPPLSSAQAGLFQDRLRRRLDREPVSYITESVDFLDCRIRVGPGVLVPRPETEWWASKLIQQVRADGRNPLRILDICTGSGCLAVALASAFPAAFVAGIDCSSAALAYAMENAAANGTSNVNLFRGDLLSALGPGAVFDLVVSNPPYISESEYPSLEPEVNRHEPSEALLAGYDGLDFYRRIIPGLKRRLASAGMVVFEIGTGQGGAVTRLLEDAGFASIELRHDLAGHDRVVRAQSMRFL